MRNKIVSVYWQDIKVYYEDLDKLTPQMLTEGILIKETDEYVYLKDPETLSLTSMKNHPDKKPTLYYIPKSLITEIVYHE